jgi:murein DD-endopeptidase MepM/ murein hydrolase activator NlpD
MDSVMLQYGESVATEVFANRYWSVASSMALDGPAAFNPAAMEAYGGLSSAGVSRLNGFAGALDNFYSDGMSAARAFTDEHGISSPRTPDTGDRIIGAGRFRPASELGFYGDDMHKAIDFPIRAGTSVASFFGGQVNLLDAVDDSSAGINVRVMLGFNFEGSFLSTGLRADAFHLQNIDSDLRLNQYIASGTQIGLSGKTNGGIDGQEHYHWQLTTEGRYEAIDNVANPYEVRMNAFLAAIGAQTLDQPAASRALDDWQRIDFLSYPGRNWNTYSDSNYGANYDYRMYANINPLFGVAEWMANQDDY